MSQLDKMTELSRFPNVIETLDLVKYVETRVESTMLSILGGVSSHEWAVGVTLLALRILRMEIKQV